MDINVILKKVKENFVSVVIIVICSIIAFKTYNKNREEIELLKQANEQEVKKNEVLQEISGLEKNFQSLRERINNKEITSSIYSLSTLAKSADVKIIFIKPMDQQLSSVFSRYPFELSVSAVDYHKLGKFVSILEKAEEFYTIERMEITGNGDQVEAHLVISTILIQ